MKAAIESAIKALATKAENAPQPHEAMNYAQAALNLAHVEATLAGAKRLEESGKYFRAASGRLEAANVELSGAASSRPTRTAG